jgi:hypothetical protein
MPEEDPSGGRVEEKGEEGRSVRGGEEGGWGGLMARGPLWIDAISVLLHVTSWLGRLMSWAEEGRGDGVLVCGVCVRMVGTSVVDMHRHKWRESHQIDR